MGILDNIGIGKKSPAKPGGAKPAGGAATASRARAGAGSAGSAGTAGAPVATRPRPGGGSSSKPGGGAASRLPGKKGKRKGAPSPKERIASAAAPLHDRRRRLVAAREATLRDLGGLMLEMYKRNRFREELLLDKCEEVLAIEVEIAHVDQRLFQLAPPNAAGMRPIGRCECGAPIHPGQNFCGVCGRPFATLTQGRTCTRCGSGLRPGDQYCATCGTEAPDALQAIEAAPVDRAPSGAPMIDATSIASSAVADTVIIEAAAPPIDDAPPIVEDLKVPARDMATPDLATPELTEGPVATPAPGGFDWNTAPAAPEAAIDAALDALPSSPTDAGTPFAGFPLTSTVPPPPIADPSEAAMPDHAATAPALAPERTAAPEPVAPAPTPAQPAPRPLRPAPEPARAVTPPAADVPPPPPVVDPTPLAPEPVTPDAASPAPVQSAPAGPVEAAPAAPAAPSADDKKAQKAAAKAAAAEQKQRAKAAKARAKQRARQARDARKRGGGE